ncbi:MAG: hypothetical protein EOP53_24350, partial [Sphingobacteriales bacterium]
AKRVLILTFKPAVEDAWQTDLQSHSDFDGWQYFNRNSKMESSNFSEEHPLVYFGSFQDLLGRDGNGTVKSQNRWLHKLNWDLVIFDEYHFGAWRETAKELFSAELAEEKIDYSKDLGIVNENLDKIVLKDLLPASIANEEVGIYGAVCKIAIFLSIFITAFRLGAEPFFFSHAKNTNAKQTYATILQYFVIALAVLFVALVANIEILKFFIRKEEYWVGLPAVPYLLMGYVFLGIYMNLSIWYRLSDQTRFGLYISVIGAVITIVLNIVLIPRFSYMGSAWVSMAAYATMTIISYILGQKYYPIPYNLKKILAYIIVSTVIVFSSFFIFNRNIYIGNAMLIAFIAGIAYFEKNDLMKILKR